MTGALDPHRQLANRSQGLCQWARRVSVDPELLHGDGGSGRVSDREGDKSYETTSVQLPSPA